MIASASADNVFLLQTPRRDSANCGQIEAASRGIEGQCPRKTASATFTLLNLGVPMNRFVLLGLLSVVTAAGPALAQQSATSPPNDPGAAAPASPSGAPASPDLAVATVKLQGGSRISKLIGSPVYNDQNEKIGSVDDLIMKDGNRVVMAVVSVGGFLGIGNKLVAVPYDQLHMEANKDDRKVTMPGASKDALNAMPTFTYNG